MIMFLFPHFIYPADNKVRGGKPSASLALAHCASGYDGRSKWISLANCMCMQLLKQ